MKKQNRVEKISKSEGPGASLPFSKKLVATIKDIPFGVAQKNPPNEFRRVLGKIVRNAGSDLVADHQQIYSPLTKRFEQEFQGGSMADAFQHQVEMMNEIMCKNPTFSSTVPVALEPHGSQKLELIGSGVLLRIVNRTFLLTAAHVMDYQEDGTLLIPGERGFMPVRGYFSPTFLPHSGRRNDDQIDAAYYWLDEDCVAELHPSCAILGRADVSLDGEPARQTDYTFAGYPWRKGNVTVGRVATSFYTCTGYESKKSEYEKYGLKKSLHIAVRFRRRKTFHQGTRRVGTAPLLHGMSGGGVYAWTQEALKMSPVRLPLIGIANTYIPGRSLLVATRLHVYVGCIFHNQPDLAAIAAGPEDLR